jgi:hypothetical protein
MSTRLFLNLSNHPVSGWSEEQVAAARTLDLGEPTDLDGDMPTVDPEADTAEVVAMAEEIAERAVAQGAAGALVTAEYTLTLSLVAALQRREVRCFAATTRREVVEQTMPDGGDRKEECLSLRQVAGVRSYRGRRDAMTWFYRCETKGIQHWILDSNRLRDLAGGSALVETLMREAEQGVSAAGGTVIYAAAGGLLATFPERAMLEAFASEWPMYVAYHAPGLQVVHAWVEGEAAKDPVNELFTRLLPSRRARRGRPHCDRACKRSPGLR